LKFEKLIYSLLLNFDYLKQSFRWLSNSNVDSEQEKKETQAVKEATKKMSN